MGHLLGALGGIATGEARYWRDLFDEVDGNITRNHGQQALVEAGWKMIRIRDVLVGGGAWSAGALDSGRQIDLRIILGAALNTLGSYSVNQSWNTVYNDFFATFPEPQSVKDWFDDVLAKWNPSSSMASQTPAGPSAAATAKAKQLASKYPARPSGAAPIVKVTRGGQSGMYRVRGTNLYPNGDGYVVELLIEPVSGAHGALPFPAWVVKGDGSHEQQDDWEGGFGLGNLRLGRSR